MRIMIIYPGHSHSTIDVAKGYSAALTALGHTVLDYNYHNYLAFYTEAIRHWAEINSHFEAEEANVFQLASEQVAISVVEFVPDVVLIVCGLALHKKAYDLIDQLCIPTILLLSESPYADGIQAAMIEATNVAVVFTNDKSSVLPLREATGKRIEYLPHSYDPNRHCPRQVSDEHRTDLFFFGTLWPERKRLFYPLKRWAARWHPEWKVHVDGVRPVMRGTPTGLTANEVLTRYYSGTRIALNHNRTIAGSENGCEVHVNGAWSLGPRAYEIAACGAFQLCDDTRPELSEIFGDSVATYADVKDLRHKIEYFLCHDDERLEMARESNERVTSCAFSERARRIIIPMAKML